MKIPSIISMVLMLFMLIAPYGSAEQAESLFSLKDLSIQDLSDASEIKLNGQSITISAPGIYALSGNIDDGSVTIDAGDESTVYLLLNGVSVTNSSGSALTVRSAEKVILTMIENTVNTFTQGESESSQEYETAAVFSICDLTLNGNGTLAVNSGFESGIACQHRLRIVSGNITVNAWKDALLGKEAVCIGGGTITASAGSGDCIKAGGVQQTEAGTIFICGGMLQLTTGGSTRILQLKQLNPSVSVPFIQASNLDKNKSGSQTGLRAASIQIAAGCLIIDAANDAIHSSGDISIHGGILTLLSNNGAIHAGRRLTVSDGTIDILQSFEGLQASDFHLEGGILHITASDAGISAPGDDLPGIQTGTGNTSHTSGTFSSSADTLSIAGSILYVLSGGNGIDINGNLTMSSGEVYIRSSQTRPDAALDYEGSFTLTGGTLIALGSSRNAQGVSSTSVPGTMLDVESGSISISTTEGTQLFFLEAEGHFDNAVIYSEQFTKNASYLITTGNSTQSAVMTLESTDP